MKSGELAAQLRQVRDEIHTEGEELYGAMLRALLRSNLPLILAALDVAQWADGSMTHAPLCDYMVRAHARPEDCNCRLATVLEALRRAEED